MIRKIKILLLAIMLVISAALILPAQAEAMTGVCVDAPGIPCSGGSSGGGGGGGSGYYVDPNYRAMIAEQRRQEAKERARKAEAVRKYKTPYRGFEKLQKETRRNIKNTLNRLDETESHVSLSPKMSIENSGEMILVPDAGLGNITLAHPVNPTDIETKIASEQLLKAAAALEMVNVAGSSSEDLRFISTQAAAIMTGSRSYIHVNVRSSSIDRKESADKVSGLLQDIQKSQRAIASSEKQREEVLEQAKIEIKELAIIGEELKNISSPVERKTLRTKMKQIESRLDAYEKEYFDLDAGEKKIQADISRSTSEIQENITWKK